MTICYVTAFLDIGRSKWKNFSRDFDNYLNAFLPYVDLFRNNKDSNYKMVVYIDERLYDRLMEHIDPVLPIQVIKINDNFLCENMPLWKKLDREQEIMDSKEYQTLIAHRLKYPETHNPRYTMINHLKVDFIAHTINLTDFTYFCWVDFGYFQLKNRIPDQLIDINLLNPNKINYTLINTLEDIDKDIYYTLKFAPEKIGGFFFFGNRSVLLEYQKLYHEVHSFFQENNLVDDDQHLALQCYFRRSDLFKLHFHGAWHMALVAFQKKMYSIVMPIKINYGNGYRLFCDFALKSYEKYLDISRLDFFYIVTPSNNIPFLTKFTDNTNIPFKYIEEEKLLKNDINVEGWFKQQLIKILMCTVVKTPYYLILDSDLYLTKHLSYNDLFYNHNIKYNSEPWQTENNHLYSQNSKWWESSCKVMDYSVESLYQHKNLMSVTPETILTQVMKNLVEELKIKYNENWQQIICNEKCTEFTLYWIFLIKNNLTNLYTTEGFPLLKHLLTHNILDYSSVSTSNIRNSFVDTKSYFSLIQGYLNIDAGPLINEGIKCLNKPDIDDGPLINEGIKCLNKPDIDAVVLIAAMLKPQRYQSFSINTRHSQLLETVASAKKYIPNSICILIEGSTLEEKYQNDYKNAFDHVILSANQPEVQEQVNHPGNIGFGECKLLHIGIKYVKEKILPYYNPKFIIKLGGRYSLTNKFSLSKYNPNMFNFRQTFDNSTNKNIFITKLYSVPISYLHIFENMLKNTPKTLNVKYSMVEEMYRAEIPNELVNLIDFLGIQGQLSYNGTYFHD